MGLAPLGEFERAVLLAVLRLGSNAYGVSIQRELEARLQREVKLASISTTLNRLFEKRCVTFSMGDPTPQRGGRAKKFVQVTAAGVDALNRTREVSDVIWSLRPNES